MFNRYRKFFLTPLFPRTNFLKQRWWHRLSIVLASFISIIGYLVLFTTIVVFAESVIERAKINEIASQLKFEVQRQDEGFDLEKINSWELGESVKSASKNKSLDKYPNKLVGQAALKKYPQLKEATYSYSEHNLETLTLIAGIIIWFAFLFSVNFFYRVILFVVVDDQWKNKQE